MRVAIDEARQYHMIEQIDNMDWLLTIALGCPVTVLPDKFYPVVTDDYARMHFRVINLAGTRENPAIFEYSCHDSYV